MKNTITIIILLGSFCILSAFDFTIKDNYRDDLLNQPESIEYYAPLDIYLISNWATGEIIYLDSDGNQNILNQELTTVAGIKILGNKLYCCERNAIGIIDLEQGVLDTLITIEGSGLLNDLVFCHDAIYVSDYWDPKIYKISLTDYSHEILVQQTNFVPNGLFYEEENDRILAVTCNANGSQARITSIDPITGETSVVVYTPYGGLDGIARDSAGSYYLSSWYVSQNVHGIFKYNSDFSNTPVLITTDCSGPADIFVYNDILAIPNLNSNSIQFLELVGNNDTAIIAPTSTLNQNYPNPFNPETTISFTLQNPAPVKLTVYNAKGEFVKTIADNAYPSGNHSVIFDGKNLSSGLYYYRLTTDKQTITKKMLLIK